ncbi:MAG: S8 family peptidase [Marmoricola sp.]
MTREAVSGLTVFTLPPRLDNVDQPDLQTLRDIDSALGAGTVTPDHVLYVTYAFLCPATEPNEPGRDLPWPRESRDTDRGAGVMINVVDTGWWKPAAQDPEAPWLAYGVDGDAEQINPAAIQPYGGHGTFVAGVIRCQAPQAQIYVDGMLTHGGAIFESDLMNELDIAVLSGDAPNIVSISGGTTTYNDQPLMTFLQLAQKHNLIDNPKAPLIVAAAGNNKTNAPFWPAAFDWVVGVGSLDRDDTVSDYSNYGDWVDIYALGRDHVNAYPTGTYTCYEPPNIGEVRQFKNLAKWSGTSFSTPLITGLLAGIMTEHGLTAREAWLRMKADGIVRTDPRVGKILTVDTPGD